MIISCLVFPQVAYQANLTDAFKGFLETAGGSSGAGYDTSRRTVDPIIVDVLNIVVSFLGIVFLFLMVYGGYIWMTAHGDEKKVQKAQMLLTAAIIGLIVIVGAYAITFYVFSRLAAPNLEI